MRIELLRPTGRQKSYYGKALIKYADNGTIILQSYDTDVCKIENGNLIRLWGGYSATTMKHINDFINQFNIIGGGKKWWDSLPCNSNGKFQVEFSNGYVVFKAQAVLDSYEQAQEFAESIIELGHYKWYDVIEMEVEA